MATAAPITNHAAANAHSWLRRALAQFAAPPASAASVCPISNTIIDLRLLLRRVDHARREYAGWDRRFLSQTIMRAVVVPLREMALAGEADRLRHGAVFALAPIGDAAFAHDRTEPEHALEDAAILLREAIADLEATRI